MDVLKAFYVQAVVAALALCVVQQGHEARRIGYRLEALRGEMHGRVVEIQKHKAQISKLKSPQRIVRLAESLGVGLGQPPAARTAADTDETAETGGEASAPTVVAVDGTEP